MDDLFVFLNGSNEEDKDCFVCVVIHNIDGPGLRDSETQEYLARVAACSHVRIIASVDHVNAPLCKHMHFPFINVYMNYAFQTSDLCLYFVMLSV